MLPPASVVVIIVGRVGMVFSRWTSFWVLLVLCWGGCAALTVPEEPPRPTPLDPVWSPGELRDHLRFLNSSETDGRATGTQGYARAAAYVAARMQEFRLQPAVGGDFRVIYGAPINYPLAAALYATGADSLFLRPGLDFLPDGRSDAGRVQVNTWVAWADTTRPLPAWPEPDAAVGVLLPARLATEAALRKLRARGARLALIVGDLRPHLAVAPVEGLAAAQVTPEAAALLLREAPARLSAWLAAGGPARHTDRDVHLRVETDYQRHLGAINILGYVAGKHPVHARELVLVCADLDAMGNFAGVRTLDFAHFGLGTAALLEVARNAGAVSRVWSVPDRSLLFAVWSGGRIGHAGLRAFLETPTWALDQVRAVIYVGLDPAEQPAVEALLAGYGLPLYALPPPAEPLYRPATVLLPAPAGRRDPRPRPAVAPPDLSAILDRAVLDARALADTTYALAMREATSLAPPPAFLDTLQVPAGARRALRDR